MVKHEFNFIEKKRHFRNDRYGIVENRIDQLLNCKLNQIKIEEKNVFVLNVF